MGVSALELRRRVLMAQPHKERKTGGIVSFNTHVPQVLGVTVPLSPAQAGTGDPYPPGGGKNLLNVDNWEVYEGGRITIESGKMTVANAPYQENKNKYTLPSTNQMTLSFHVKTIALNDARASFKIYADGVAIKPTQGASESGNIMLDSVGHEADVVATLTGKQYISLGGWGYQGTVEISNIQLEFGSTATEYAPYSNIRPISGHTGAAVDRTGKNLRLLTFSQINTNNILTNTFSLKKGTYTFSVNYNGVPTWGVYLRNGHAVNAPTVAYGYNKNVLTFTLDRDYEELCVSMYYGNGISVSEVTELMLNVGATATEYAPYSGESFPVTFPATGKNLLDLSWFASQTVNGVTFTKDDGQISVNGTATGTINLNGQYFLLPPGTYTLSGSINNNQLYILDAATNTVLIENVNGNVRTVTITEQKTVYLRIRVGNGATVNGIVKPMLNEGSTALPYEPYTTTVYGGRLEPAAGRLVVDRVANEKPLSAFNVVSTGANTKHWRYLGEFFQSGAGKVNNNDKAISNICNYGYNSNDNPHFYIAWNTANQQNRIELWLLIDTPASTNIQICAELAEPLIIPLTPAEIRALMGENNVFADSGDVDVEFWTN